MDKNKVSEQPDIDRNQVDDESILEPNAEAGGTTRRDFVKGGARLAALVFLVKIGVLPKNAIAKEMAAEATGTAAEATGTAAEATETVAEISDEEIEKMLHEPFGLAALDAFGTISFVDAIMSIALEKDSVTQRLFMLSGLPTYNTGELTHKHQVKFPLENIHLAIILNIIRATTFGPEVSHHTIDEFFTTLKGVGLLLGLTSMAKGIVAAEAKTGEMAKTDTETLIKNPAKVLGNSIFQLTVVATSTQLPLTAFGNASIGNGEFGEVRASFDNMYLSLMPDPQAAGEMSFNQLKTHIKQRLGELNNPAIKKRVKAILKDGEISEADLRERLKEESTAHTNDLMTILMSTACDDAQAAMGDAGPLVGLYQMYGADFLKVVLPMLPYTVMIALDRATFAAERAGIHVDQVLSKERFGYLGKFLKETWKNLIYYFVNVAPKISSKITGGSDPFEVGNGDKSPVGRDFTVVEQIFADSENIIGSAMDAVLGSFNGSTLDVRKVKAALTKLHRAESDYLQELGSQVVAESERTYIGDEKTLPVNRSGIGEVRERIVGKKSEDEDLAALQNKLEEMALKPNEKAIEEFASTLKGLREEMGPELAKELAKLVKKSGGKTPSILAVAKVLQDNPRVRDLLDVNYWHHRIGPELTDTMFVVFLQGLHLPFIINTFERAVYNNPSFGKLPLPAQEVVSMFLNDGVSMFADNWADCVAHSKWLTVMYFNELSKTHVALAEKYPSEKGLIENGHFEDNKSELIPERFEKRKQQFAALTATLKSKHPEDAEYLNDLTEKYFDAAQKYYYKSMVMSMTAAVTGGGKAKTGNAPHFTFAAGEDDFTLIETLNDFKRHPLYHAYEFIFSTGYAILVGPEIANALFGVDSGKQIAQMMQKKFRSNFPEFEKKLNELKEREAKASGHTSPAAVKKVSRRGLFRALRGGGDSISA